MAGRVALKLDNMRTPQEFVHYPLKEGATDVIIQSDKRIGQFDLETGKGVLSVNKANGAFFMHLTSFMGAKEYTLTPEQLKAVKELIQGNGTEIRVGVGVSALSPGSAAVRL